MKGKFEPLKSLAGYYEPGDMTRYELVAVERWDTVEVVVLNDAFFDRIIFLKDNALTVYRSFRGEDTNPWTIKAARNLAEELMRK
jgi:hypothetical protein